MRRFNDANYNHKNNHRKNLSDAKLRDFPAASRTRHTCHASGRLTKFSAIFGERFSHKFNRYTLHRNGAGTALPRQFQRVLAGSFHVKWQQLSIDTRSRHRKCFQRAYFTSFSRFVSFRFPFDYLM